ncbi:MAG: alpha/beta fold hydrolase [Candidatus Omnitrophota bacterium]|nr:alpha/beta fold hydrolase [Candidatus Omnitrophota bacterium]
MRKVYLTVFIIFVVSAILFTASLFYLDKEKHKLLHFTVNIDGRDMGTIKVDKFITDENLLYKSQSSMPFEPLLTDSKSRLTLDKRYSLINYTREESGGGAQNTVLLDNINDNISFVGTAMSEFAYIANLPIKHNTFVFEEYSPVTYLPILENYDFDIGQAQAFNVVMCYSPLLPPMKKLLILTSIRDEYIKIGSRKTKVECLLIKMRNFPQGMLFVTKTGRSLVGIEFPEKKIKITRTFTPKDFEAGPFILKSDTYTTEEVKINDKKTALTGTLAAPKDQGIHPAVLLISGTEESDREEQGLFTHLCDTLARNGFLTLRFDKRGIGSSGGDSKSTTDSEAFDDAKAALNYLFGRKDADIDKIILIGHGKGALDAAKIASETKNVKALILLSPLITSAGQMDLNFDSLNEMAAKRKWDEQYLKLTIKSRMETIDKVKNIKGDWATILRTRCFLKKLREDLQENPIDIIRKVECPVLILQGKEDELIPPKDVSNLDKALEDSGNKNHKLIYYGYLGHFLGKPINDGVHKLYYETDPAVLDTIKKWLEGNV